MTTASLQPGSAGIDTFIRSSDTDANFGAYILMCVGATSAGGTQKSLIKFDLSSIPVGATIISAILRLNVSSENDASINLSVGAYRSLVEWFEGPNTGAAPGVGVNGSTWVHRNHGFATAWAGGANTGGVAGSDYVSTATATTTITGPGKFDWNVTADVQGFVSGSLTNHGWFLHTTDITTNGQKNIDSSDAVTAGNRPELIIEYDLDEVGGTAHGTSTAVATVVGYASISGEAHGTSTATAPLVASLPAGGEAHGTSTASATAESSAPVGGSSHGTSSAVAELIGLAVEKAFVEACEITPLLYITDGNIKANGQLDMLDLLNPQVGFMLKEWNPAIAQYKSGGYFSDSPLGEGRRLARRVFENAVEVLTLALKSHNQNRVIRFTRDFFRWKEAAADYWSSDWLLRPVYMVARAPQETELRYAPIHVMDIPALTNPYGQPFYGRQWSAIENIALRIERGAWADQPPGQAEPVAISSIRSYTVADWGESP